MIRKIRIPFFCVHKVHIEKYAAQIERERPSNRFKVFLYCQSHKLKKRPSRCSQRIEEKRAPEGAPFFCVGNVGNKF